MLPGWGAGDILRQSGIAQDAGSIGYDRRVHGGGGGGEGAFAARGNRSPDFNDLLLPSPAAIPESAEILARCRAGDHRLHAGLVPPSADNGQYDAAVRTDGTGDRGK